MAFAPSASKNEPAQKPSYKELLDQAASDQRKHEQEKPNPVVEKIAEYVPAAAQVLGNNQNEESARPAPDAPPKRPVHDDKIEEFVRDQHRSNCTDGMLNGGSNDE